MKLRFTTRARRAGVSTLAAAVLAASWSVPAAAEDDAVGSELREGEVITFDGVAKLEKYLPEELWPHRDFIFYEGMRLEIGPRFADDRVCGTRSSRAVSSASRSITNSFANHRHGRQSSATRGAANIAPSRSYTRTSVSRTR